MHARGEERGDSLRKIMMIMRRGGLGYIGGSR
jgi:hypothetical protein